MSLMRVVRAMKNHAEEIALPETHKGDLYADYGVLERYGDTKYLWVLRRHGSLLFPIKKGIPTAYVDWHIRNDESCRLFVVDGYSSKPFKEVDRKKAHSLAHSKPIDFKQITCRKELVSRVNALLKDENVTMPLFERPHLTIKDDWARWQQWFSANNPLMENVMAKAVIKYKELGE